MDPSRKDLCTALCAARRCRLACTARRESAIEALQPKPASPAWLVEEVEAVRRGLMDLLHNVVLLRCPDSNKEFTPVRPHR